MSHYIAIRVTAADIAAGKPMSIAACPVALALRRLLPDARVTEDFSDFTLARGWQRVRNPPRLRRFVQAFDAGKPVEPATFRLRAEP